MTKINSKQKGKVGEREWATKCREHGYDCKRGQQYCGADGSADVIGIHGIHIEVKRVENLNVSKAIKQAVSDAREGEKPIVAHRKNGEEWLITMRAEDWFDIFREYHSSKSL